ncbi:response regulator [Paenibacillus hemerocallicola]|uniref:Response regulator n=1 Tax=Paenibacillus hemerocallicola TaxID=1172614 RepID=A0A5C4TB08_9BACL|nr:response regulator [Paenibacillus hemerocallicola]TNJ65790.1 response regulator [Paenibacillus hemerocallicola]
MKSVMIVDDESMVRLGLQTVIDWRANGYEIAGVYKNGLEAWNAINASPPDVLLTDIRMPEMDGLELIRRVRESGSALNVVILSSYEEFDYARQALQLQVQDYIVKHRLEADSLLGVLNRLVFPKPERHEESEPSMRADAAARLLGGTEPGESFGPGETAETLLAALRPASAAAQSVHWSVFEPLTSGMPLTSFQLKGLEIALIDKLRGAPAAAAYAGAAGNRLHVLHWLEAPCHDAEAWLERTGLAWEPLQSFARTNLNVQLAVGIGSGDPSRIGEARASAEALLVGAFYDGPGLYANGMRTDPVSLDRCDWTEAYKTLKPLLMAHDFDRVIREIRSMRRTDTGQRLHPADLKQLCGFCVNRLMDMVLERYPQGSDREQWRGELQSIRLEELAGAGSWPQAETFLRKAFERIGAAIAQSVQRNGWIGELKAYIAQHYEKPLRLEDMAARVNFSVGYISQRFHQETGYSFSDYVTMVRIEKAIQLLHASDWTTERIAEKVGYPNANYFTKVFKKVTGLKLTEFKRKRLLRDQPEPSNGRAEKGRFAEWNKTE